MLIISAEARKMPYLQAVIKKGLRIHPPITGLLAKLVNPGEEVIKGHFVLGGIVSASSETKYLARMWTVSGQSGGWRLPKRVERK